MIEIHNSETLQRWLLESGHLGRLWDRPRFRFDRAEFEREVDGVREQYPQFSTDEAEARAALRLLGKEEGRSRALIVGRRRSWTRRERMFLVSVVLLVTMLVLLLCAPRAHAQELQPALHGDYVLGQPRPWAGLLGLTRSAAAVYRADQIGLARGAYRADQSGGQPGGVIWYWQNGGSALHTFAGGVGYVNCSTNITCAYAGNPPTITITGSGGSGSECIPPGTTANALLFDSGSGACNDIPKLTWTGGTSTVALLSGGIFDPTAGTMKVPGTNGQLLYNNSGALGAEDPVVSGPDARGAAQSKNPVAGLAGIDYTTNCSSGPCVQEAKVDTSGNVFVDVTNTVPVSGTFWQTTQPVSGTFWQTTQPVSAASLPLPSGASTAANQCGASTGALCYAQPSDGTHSMPMGDASARTIHVTADNSSIAVTGTFWQTTQPVSGTFWQTTQPVSCTTSNCMVKADIFGNAGGAMDQAPGSAAPANALQVGLTDGTNTRAWLSDATGRPFVKTYPDTTNASFHASKNVASAASATDIAVLPGNATNTVLVTRVIVSCTQTTAGIITLQLIKRSAADSSGTSSAMTVVPDDANYSAGVSAPLVYTANPTTGAAVGNVDTALVGCMATGTATPNDIYVFRPAKPIVLRGTAQQLAVNLNAVAVTGGSFDVTFEYMETTTP